SDLEADAPAGEGRSSLAGDPDAARVFDQTTRNGTAIKVEIASRSLRFAGRDARLVVATDVTERLVAEAALNHQALHDALTSLPNRALLHDRLSHALARSRRAKSTLAVFFLDIDRFKTINDSLGHGVGDELLVAVAARLTQLTRHGDTVG